MGTFVISNLDTQNFTFENIRFERLTYNSPIEKQWHEEYSATFQAIADDDLNIKPIIQDKGPIGVINDICLLLSLAQSRIIFCPEYTMGETTTLMRYYRIGKPTAGKWVNDDKIEPFLNSAAQILREPRFAHRSGFIPAAYYLLIGDSDEIGEVSFMFPWIALEILANAHAEKKGISIVLHSNIFKNIAKPPIIEALNQLEKEERLTPEQKELIINKLPELNRPSIRYKICKLRNAHEWGFITDGLLGEYIKLRDGIMHLGTHGNIQSTRMQDLSIKLRMSIYLALIDLIGCSNYISHLHHIKQQIRDEE